MYHTPGGDRILLGAAPLPISTKYYSAMTGVLSARTRVTESFRDTPVALTATSSRLGELALDDATDEST